MKFTLTLVALCGLMLPPASAVEFGAPFKDGCVLQRQMPVCVWGWAKAHEKVHVSFRGATAETVADGRGEWRVTLPAMEAACDGSVLSANDAVVRDVLVGEVWLAAGQSNMELPLWSDDPHRRDQDGCLVAQTTRKPQVRFFKSPKRRSREPEMRIDAGWRKAVPEEILIEGKWAPSAIGFYFATGLEDALRVPVGIVEANWGGTDIDAWTPAVGYAGKAGLERERDWQWLADADWDDSTYNHGLCGGPQQQPRVLWNGMVAAYTNMAFRGVLWYQGCQNIREPERYCAKMHALYDGWAKSFGKPGMPFYFAQLAPFGDRDFGDTRIMEAQEKFYREQPNAGMVVTCDRGNIRDCHPNEKGVVARRLLAYALKRQYGFESVRPDPPVVCGWSLSNGVFRLDFDARGERPFQYCADWSVDSGFEIRDEAGAWHPAQVRELCVKERKDYVSRGIMDAARQLTVSAPGIGKPTALRYLYAGSRVGTIKNRYGHPLGPFHIDVPSDRPQPVADEPQGIVGQLWRGGGVKISDFSSAVPAEACVRGKPASDRWELVDYDTTQGKGTMLYSRCGATPRPVTVAPKLTGWHRIYVATFSGNTGRLWLRLSGDASPSMLLQGWTGRGHWNPCEQGEEIFWKCADLTDRTIEIGKPDGVQSAEKRIGLMWLRFEPMTADEIAAAKAEFASPETRRLHAHSDMDWIHFYGPDITTDEFCSMIDEYAASDVSVASLEVYTSICDKTPARRMLAGPEAKLVEFRWPTQLALDARRDELYRAAVRRAERHGIRLLAAHRMGLSNFILPSDDICASCNSFVTDHPEWRCRDRDGEPVGFLSYAYPEVGDYMIGEFLKQVDRGFHGATLILHRGIEILFEEPVLAAFRKAHPGVDPRTLSLDDPRLAAVRCAFMTDFMRRLRKAFDDYSAAHGRPRLWINPIVNLTLADNRRLGFDVETWAREKLIDSAVAGAMRIWEDEERFRDDSDPKRLSVAKYAALKRTSETSPVRRMFYNRAMYEETLKAIPDYAQLSRETGVRFHFDIQWEGSLVPEAIPAYVQRLYDAGAENLNLWDCFEFRVSHRPEWFVTSRLGHRKRLRELPTKQDAYRRLFRILKLDGGDFSGYHPSWRG